MIDQKIILHLVLVKYLKHHADEQLKMPEPMCLTAILPYQDAIELFFQTVTTYLDIKTNLDKNKNISFHDYIKSINSKLLELDKVQFGDSTLKKLNESRINFKHFGNLPHKNDLEETKIFVNYFFEEQFKNIFDIEYKDVSLIDAIIFEKTKSTLKEAKIYFENNDIEKCLKKLSISFKYLIEEYNSDKIDEYERPLLELGKIEHHPGISSAMDNNLYYGLENVIKTLNILILGIDYKKYILFKTKIPEIRWDNPNEEGIIFLEINDNTTKEDFEYCYNFIIESALKLQEFDFESKEQRVSKSLLDF